MTEGCVYIYSCIGKGMNTDFLTVLFPLTRNELMDYASFLPESLAVRLSRPVRVFGSVAWLYEALPAQGFLAPFLAVLTLAAPYPGGTGSLFPTLFMEVLTTASSPGEVVLARSFPPSIWRY